MNPNSNSTSTPEIQEWEAKARVWLSALPNQTNVTINQVEAWINSNQVPLPEPLRSSPLPQLYEKILSLKNSTPQPHQGNEKGKAPASHPARFQRTDQWIPVYAWLESLDKNEVVKSKEINEWLSENPDVKEKLFAKHSRYHLMHYVQKCHMKILKRQGKLLKNDTPSSAKVTPKVLNNGAPTLAVAVPHSGASSVDEEVAEVGDVLDVAVCYLSNDDGVPSACRTERKRGSRLCRTPSSNLLKNTEVSLAKQNEAFRRYQLFTELENQLSSLLNKTSKQLG